MKRHWEVDELIEYWTLLPDEEALLGNKTGANRLGFAILLKFFQLEVRFPQHIRDIPKPVVVHLSKQVGVPSEEYHAYDWQGRSIKYHRAEIRSFLGFHKATVSDAQEMANWLVEQVLGHEQDLEHLEALVIQRFRSQRIESPTNLRINRLIRSALRTYEKNFFSSTLQKFSRETKTRIDAFLGTVDSSEDKETTTLQRDDTGVTFSDLKADPGRVGLESLLSEVAKLLCIRQLALPPKLFESISPKVLEIYKLRVTAELPSQLRAHPEAIRYTLFAAFCYLRSQEITDSLVELLLQIVHRLGKRAENKVEKELLQDFKRVSGKTGLLYQLAEVTVANPEGIVQDVVYPVVGKQTLIDLVKEFKSTGTAYRQKVYTLLPDVPTEEEIQRYYEAVWHTRNMQDMVMIKTLLYTGVRVSELINIHLEDIDFVRCQIRINQGKGGKDRIVPFPVGFKEVLAMHVDSMQRKQATYLFESSWKRKYSDRGVRKILEKYALAAGLNRAISPHRLRHFLLTWLKKQGIDDALIQPYSGHSSRQSLEVYSRLSIGEAQKEYDGVMGKFPV